MTNGSDLPPADEGDQSLDVAIVGMAARFPMAPDVQTFWKNLRNGVCAVTRLDQAQLRDRSVPAETLADPSFVPAAYLLEGSDTFDAGFFGYSPREAELMDPQHRVLLECAWEAVEAAGLDPARYPGTVGVFAGAGHNTYLLSNIAANAELVEAVGGKQVLVGNRSDFLSTRVSYKLGLEGPSLTVQTACSTSLVATVQAVQSLLAYECDAALAGGVAVEPTRHDGYTYREDGILSPDGLTRTLDRAAQGTVGGDGVGMVVLKRLEDALADGDHIHAVIKGCAINNDGAHRAGFSAPSATAQSEVVVKALANADVLAEQIGYVELHGTATNLGDPIEISALRTAYAGVAAGNCAVGSVKTNIGHLDAAAGVAGLIKTVLILEHGQIPPSLHYNEPNPRLDLDAGPFRVATELTDWPAQEGPRRAAVSSFGLGGTNAHVVLQQAPAQSRPADAGGEQLLIWSARTESALELATERLQNYLRTHPEQRLADVALTLQKGRKPFAHRRVLVAEDLQEAVSALEARDDGRLMTAGISDRRRPIGFLFDGFGSQFPGMAHDLYRDEPVFREALDECARHAEAQLGADLRELLIHPAEPDRPDGTKGPALQLMLAAPEVSDHPIDQPGTGYPAVFAFQYALAELWASWGIRPAAMIGHSLGEYVAACRAGVFSLPDALRLVMERARLIEAHGTGAMLAVALTEPAVARFLTGDVSVAAVNDSTSCVLSGSTAGIESVAKVLGAEGVVCRLLSSPYAFHSPLMDPVVEPYSELLAGIRMRPPTVPFVSNVTGTWITDEEATSPAYWARHLRERVRFADGIGVLWTVPDIAMVELGVGQTLMTSALQHPAANATDRTVVQSLSGPFGGRSSRSMMLRAAGRLWLAGAEPELPASPDARRVPLPSYPFERRRYWLEPQTTQPSTSGSGHALRRTQRQSWWYEPTWRRTRPVAEAAQLAGTSWLVFADDLGVGSRTVERLRAAGAEVATVAIGTSWHGEPGRYTIDPADTDHYRRLADSLRQAGPLPGAVLHCWGLQSDVVHLEGDPGRQLLLGFESLVQWAQIGGSELMTGSQRWRVVTTGTCSVLGDEVVIAAKAAVQGFCKVLQQEYPGAECLQLDIGVETAESPDQQADRLFRELAAPIGDRLVALRGTHRWIPSEEQAPIRPAVDEPVSGGDVYLITGGLGKIGLIVAQALAERAPGIRLILTGRTGLPDRSEWAADQPPALRRTIRAVEAMEKSGAEVRVEAADVADLDRMRQVIDRALTEYGRFDGVVHCAGTTGERAHRTISELAAEQTAWHFGPKLAGAEVLRELLAGRRLKLALLCSSISSILGGLGFAAYAGANASLDAFAQQHHHPDQPWSSVNWEAWRFPDDNGLTPQLGEAVELLAVTPQEGRRLVDELIGSVQVPQVVVSTGDLARRRELWTAPGESQVAVTKHDRPALRNPFVAPGTETERRVAAVWEQTLGVSEVGVHDNFFELGGSSLLGLQIVHRLRNEGGIAVPLTAVYEGPTVRTLAKIVDEARGGRR